MKHLRTKLSHSERIILGIFCSCVKTIGWLFPHKSQVLFSQSLFIHEGNLSVQQACLEPQYLKQHLAQCQNRKNNTTVCLNVFATFPDETKLKNNGENSIREKRFAYVINKFRLGLEGGYHKKISVVKVFIRDRSPNMENVKIQPKHKCNGQTKISKDCKDPMKYSTIHFSLALLFKRRYNMHFTELQVESEQGNTNYFKGCMYNVLQNKH